MTKMPDFNPFPYGTTVINYSGWMCIIIRFHEYLLFEGAYCQELIQLGYDDAMKKEDAIKAFLHIPESYCNNVVALRKA